MFTKSSSRSRAYQLSQTGPKSSSHARPTYLPNSWDFVNFNGTKKDKGDYSSEENILPPDNYRGARGEQDIKKTTVITIDRDEDNLSAKGEPEPLETRGGRRAPSTEPPTAWHASHAV